MHTLRRRPENLIKRILLIGVVVGIAWLIRQTQGPAIFEAYYWLTRPFHISVDADLPETLINAKIQELDIENQELKKQNEELKTLVDYRNSKKEKGVIAPIIGRSADHWWQQVTLGRGRQDGIEPGFIVMAPGGLVGQITTVTSNTSRVLLISDQTSKVGVSISRSRQMGFMRGQNTGEGVMEFFDNSPDIKVGDAVVTSAYSQLFPAGLPVGKVSALDINKTPAPEATIEFSAPIYRVEWVIIYPHKPSPAQ